MHELAVCNGLLTEVERVAVANNASRVAKITVAIGPLSGVEAHLLEQAFTVARAGTVAASASLEIEPIEPRIQCTICGAAGPARINRLICGACGAWQVRLTSGEEMILKSVELERNEAAAEDAEKCA